MFPFWYGHYPYQVAEYDECPVSGPWDFPRPLMAPVPEERWSRPSVLWRPWFSKGTDLFSFFQVETMVVRRGKGRPMSKRTDSLLRAFTGAKILKEAPDVYSSLSWSLRLKKQHSYVRRQPLCKAIPWVLSLWSPDISMMRSVRKENEGRPEVSYHDYERCCTYFISRS